MDQLLFLSIISSALNVFIIVYAYSLNFFPKKWKKKVDQDALVGLALIFAVDRPLDMCRTAINVTGDATVSMFVNKFRKK